MKKIFSLMKKIIKKLFGVFGIEISRKHKPVAAASPNRSQYNLIYWPHNRIVNWMNDKYYTNDQRKWYIQQLFVREVGYFPNIDNPQTFNEKIHWMSLNYHNPLITTCVDKYSLKKYISDNVGKEYVVPLIGSWDKVEDIDFDSLPKRFAIKVNWGDGPRFGFIVKDKSKINLNYLKAQLSDRMQPWQNGYYHSFFWGYKNVVPKIIAEEYIEQPDGKLNDYKMYCYGGKLRHTLVCTDRDTVTKYLNMDEQWQCFAPSKKSVVDNTFPKPKMYNQMVEMAEKLAAPFPFCRVDFYETRDRIFVGEMTFHPNCGFNHYKMEWDLKMGSWIDLPEKID